MSGVVLEIKNLTRRFGSFTAVDALTLSVNTGEVFGLLGSDGAGKTTTIKMLTTLLPPSSGEARVAGFPSPPRRSACATSSVMCRRRSPWTVRSPATRTCSSSPNFRSAAPRTQARIAEALEFMGLTADGGSMVSEYSGGMVRRLEIAQSTLHRPKVLFLDEPTVGLDPIARAITYSVRAERHKIITELPR